MRLTSSRLKETSVRVLFCTIVSDNVISSEVEGSRDETHKVQPLGSLGSDRGDQFSSQGSQRG
jgi:hypothetical protein